MSPQDPPTTIDGRAQAAAAHLRAEAAGRARPAFDPDHTPATPTPAGPRTADPRRPARLALAAAAVVAVVVGGTVWVTGRDDGGTTPAGEVRVDEIRPYLFDPVPDGFELAGVAETDGTQSETWDAGVLAGGPLTTFGPSVDDPRLGVTVMATDLLDSDEDGGAREVEVGGRTALLRQSAELGSTSVLSVPLDGDPQGRHLVVIGRDVDDEVIIAVAEATTTEELTSTVADHAVPDGWERLDVDESGLVASSPLAAARGGVPGRSRMATYLAGGKETTTMLSVAVVGTTEAATFTQRLLLTDSESTTVRGHRAVVGRVGGTTADMPDGTWVVMWPERPGEALTVTGTGVSRDQLLAAAETIQPADDATWAELLESTALGDLLGWQDGTSTEEVGRGTFADGTAWVLRLRTDQVDGDEGETTSEPMLDLTVAVTGDSSSSTETGSSSFSGVGTAIDDDGNPVAGEPTALGSLTTLEQGGRRFASGFTTAAAARVVLVDADGRSLGDAQLVAGAGIHAWVAELTTADGSPAGQPVAVVAYDDDGTELARRDLPTVNDDGSTHYPGDPDSSGSPTTTAGG